MPPREPRAGLSDLLRVGSRPIRLVLIPVDKDCLVEVYAVALMVVQADNVHLI